MSQQYSVAVIGAGAIGSYYGSRLAETGHDVHFLMRRDYHFVRAAGLRITSPDGDLVLPGPKIAQSSGQIGPVDWVLCALKTTSIAEARELVQPCVADDTRILVLMNGLGMEERFAEWFDPNYIFGGMAFTCINRGEPGCVHHLAHGPITIAHFRNNPLELENALVLWERSKVKVSASTSLRFARWQKLCWNIPFSGLCVAAGGIPTDSLAGNAGLRDAALTLMEEVITAGNADLAANSETARLDRDAVVTDMFYLTETMGSYRPSLLIDFLKKRQMEIEAMFVEPLRRAQLLSVDTPQLKLLTALLLSLNALR